MTYYFQAETNECGLVCIAIALKLLGNNIDLSDLRRRHAVSSRGLHLKDMVDIAAANDLVTRAVRCELGEIDQLKCPAILHWGMQHYVVLERVRRGRAIIHDPAAGRSSVDLATVSRYFTGVALEISTTTGFKRRREKSPLSLWSWFRLAPSMYGNLVQVLLLSLLLQVYVIASPFYMQLAIDEAALKGDAKLLVSLALGFGLFALFNACANAMRGYITLRLTAMLNWDMTIRLFRHMIRLPLPWFQRRKLADVLSRFDSIAPVRDLISGSLISTIIDGMLTLTTAVMMFVFSAKLSVVVMISLLLSILLRLASLPVGIRLGMDTLTARIAENSKRIETVRAIQTLKVMGGETARESDWANKFASVVKKEQKQALALQVFGDINGVVESGTHILLIYLGANAILDGSMTVGLLYAFMSYQSQFSGRTSSLFDQILHWRMTDMYSYRLADIVLSPQEPGIDTVVPGMHDIAGEIELRDLAFGYAGQEAMLFKNISLKIRQGEFVAIVGPSGIGKSTLLKIICGLYPASAGEVAIDGRSLDSWGVTAVRRSLGVVMQDDELLAGTIAENVAFFDEHIDMELVWDCLRRACLADDVLAMPMRSETYIGDMGSNLSGGQKQRLLLARALYRRPKILILDEATSHLDSGRERAINNALRQLEITRIVVAHRQETIDAADRVLVLSKHGVSEQHAHGGTTRSPSQSGPRTAETAAAGDRDDTVAG